MSTTKQYNTKILLEMVSGKDIFGDRGESTAPRRVTELTEFILGSVSDAYATDEEVRRARVALLMQQAWLADVVLPIDQSSRGLRAWADSIVKKRGSNIEVRSL